MSRYHYETLASESEFEEMVCELYNAIHATDTFQIYKSRGSGQYGIDIFSRERGVVIQCKKKDPGRTDKELRAELAADLRESVTKAHGLPFGFKTFVLATTTKKYGDVQDLAIELSGQFPFSVQLLAWKDIEKHIHFHTQIRSRYYPHLKSGKKSIPWTDPAWRARRSSAPSAQIAAIKNSIIERFNKLGDERAETAWPERVSRHVQKVQGGLRHQKTALDVYLGVAGNRCPQHPVLPRCQIREHNCRPHRSPAGTARLHPFTTAIICP